MKVRAAQISAFNSARNRAFNANDIDGDPALKPGPWQCIVDGCDASYSHKKATYRSRGGGEPVPITASFVLQRGERHNESVAHEYIPPIRVTDPQDERSRRYIHRLKGLPGRDVEPSPSEPTGSTVTRTVYPYGEDVSGVHGLIAFARACEADPDLAITERIRISGVNYWWNQLWYGPNRDAYNRATEKMEQQFSPTGTAYFVEGYALGGPSRTAGPWFNLQIRSDMNAYAPRIWISVEESGENWEQLTRILPGTPLAVFAHHVHTFNSGRVTLQLKTLDQIVFGVATGR